MDAKHIGIIGTGMMGASLAVLFNGNGYRATMLALNGAEAKSGLDRYAAYYGDLVAEGLITDAQAAACRRLLEVTQDYAGLADADVLFECVVERLEVKYGVYREVEAHCSRFGAIASSTSAFSADDLAKGIGAADKLLVAHPWNPPHLVPCIELVKNARTSDAAVDLIYRVLKNSGRAPVVMKKGAPGFIGNRLQHALYREAVHMVEQGIATPEDIDLTLNTSFGPRYSSIGLFQHFDYAGLDMIKSIDDYLFPDLSTAPAAQPLVNDCIAAGNLGFKTGKGVLDWSGVDIDAFRKKAAKPYLAMFNWNLPEA